MRGWIFSSYLLAIAAVAGGGEINAMWLQGMYIASFWSCILILLISVFRPIFGSAITSPPIRASIVAILFLMNVGLFQAILLLGLDDQSNLLRAYTKYGLLLQIINIVFFLACAQGLSGPFKIKSSLRNIIENPLGTLGYWIGYASSRRRKGR